MDKLRMMTNEISQENIAKIRELFPSAVKEVKDLTTGGGYHLSVDFDVLKQELSGCLIDDGQERYQFTWPDKRKSVVLANSAISATLRPVKEDETSPSGEDASGKPYISSGSVDFDTTQNLYIEGDNLKVLKLLRETYLGKVKMIYIDPPYNTGNDFVYGDDFTIKSDEWGERSGDYDEEGNRLVKNVESNGRFHTDWLNMIYPRLRLARDLLTDDGVIFISIDDTELYNLKKVSDEVFGGKNFICNFIRKNKAGSGHDSANIAVEFDYVLCYVKDFQFCKINQEIVDVQNDEKYKYEDEYVGRRGKYYLRDLDYRGSYSEGLDYPIESPDGTVIYSGGKLGRPNTWRWSKQKFEWGKENGFIVFQKRDEQWKVYIKQYQFVDNNDENYVRTIPYRALIDFSNGLGSTECLELLGNNVFSYPKPSALVKYFLNIASDKDSIILDFFSGSATTAHAVMQLNAEDGGHRKFIMVQLPEPCDEKSEAYKAGYKNICEIGKERIRRAGKKIKEENGLTAQNLDIGFRVLKLDSSNMQDVYYNPHKLTQTLLETTIDNIKPDRTPLDLLFQVMLELGVPLSAKIEEKQVGGKTYYAVNGNDFIACFDNDIDEDVITAIAKEQPLYAAFKDKSFATDSVAINNEQLFKTYSPITKIKVV